MNINNIQFIYTKVGITTVLSRFGVVLAAICNILPKVNLLAD